MVTANTLTIACCQTVPAENLEAGWKSAQLEIKKAADLGADLVAFPEHFLFISSDHSISLDVEEWESRLGEVASENGIAILAGSVRERIKGESRYGNTSILLGRDGALWGRYRKIHLFDVDIPDGPVEIESRDVIAGTEVVCASTPWGKFGMSVCYDLRFPELYREMALSGARLFFVPAAFRSQTGRDHWLELLRARAIENQAFVVAPAHWGTTSTNRTLYGRSTIIDPWGTPKAICSDGPGIITATLDLEESDRLRERMPVLDHVCLIGDSD